MNFLFEKVVLLLQQQVPLLKCLKLSALLLHLLGGGGWGSLMIDSHSRNLSVVPWWSLVNHQKQYNKIPSVCVSSCCMSVCLTCVRLKKFNLCNK